MVAFARQEFARQEDASEPETSGFRRLSVKPLRVEFGLHEMPLAELLGGSVSCGEIGDDDLPVFMPEHVLEEVVALHEQAGRRSRQVAC